MPSDWFATSGAQELRANSALEYREYVRRSEHCASSQFEEDLRQIELDLPRTDESIRLFLLRPEEREALDEDEELPPHVTERFLPLLRNILAAYSVRNPRVGYVQGHADVLCFLLGNVNEQRDEEETFWVYASVMERVFPDDFFARTPKLHGFQVDCKLFHELVVRKLVPHYPILAKVDLPLVTTLLSCKWFVSLWVGELPLPLLYEVWDTMLREEDGIILHLLVALHFFRLAVDKIQLHMEMEQWDSSYIYKIIMSQCQTATEIAPLELLQQARSLYGLKDESVEDMRTAIRRLPQLCKAEFAVLAKQTHFSHLEMERLQDEFTFLRFQRKMCGRSKLRGLRQEGLEGILSRELSTWPVDIYGRIYHLLKPDGYGNISFSNLIQFLSVASRGTPEERARLLFQIPNHHDHEYLNQQGIEKLADLLCCLLTNRMVADAEGHRNACAHTWCGSTPQTMVAGSGLVLTPAQRTLVEKSRAVRQQRAAALEAQQHLEARNRAYVQDIKAHCRVPQHRRLILRHVGEELARVAHRERLLPSKARPAPQHASNNRKTHAASDREDQDQPFQHKPQSSGDDGYDEERFGPVRRPPRKQPPNLWVPIFEQEVAEVQQAKEEAERKRVAAAAEYREQLAQQDADKQRRRLDEKATADMYARAQAAQQAAWREQEKVKQKQREDQVVLEAQRWQHDLRAQAEAVRVVQETKERNERRALERFRLLDEEDKRRKAERKAADMEEVVRVKQANAKQLEIKRQVALREQQEDLELQKAYEKKLEMQEAARRAELDAILAKQSQKVKLALLNVKSAEEKALEDEQRALVMQAAVRAREAELLEQKEHKKREAARVQMQALTVQREEKRSRRLSLEQEEAVYASKLKADFQTWQKEQVTVKEKVNHRNREYLYQQLVKQQMAEDARRRADEDKYGMTLLEAELNTKLLQKAGIASPPKDIHRR
ncbi:hypothetical protein PF008_g21006 [Phytophthora fragariae]|uniref:Rab-GAP TBC domain-containing protein n=1 Tax=Phytophthora fragariae TaxID=53985 RepID=A0A6G0QYK3_9STRA|nr:hypothetical protein PF008_g21006 [Phytophthora fragariae]